jgi:hypothetical protein
LWFYGGLNASYKSDLWRFNPSTNQWACFQDTAPATANPWYRKGAVSWTDQNGKLWLFGGYGYLTSNQNYGYLNDLWRYDPLTLQWTRIGGSSTVNALAQYGTQGVTSSSNWPGSRHLSVSLIDITGNLWLWGGQGFGTYRTGSLNDLWKYDPGTNQWTWVKGASDNNQGTVYDKQGLTVWTNSLGGRYANVGWVDNANGFWFYGDQNLSNGLWKLSNVTTTTYYRDADKDGYGDVNSTVQASGVPTGYVANKTDCDDNDNTKNPGVTEKCDGIDNDCDGQVDEGVVASITYYLDSDEDGYGDAAKSVKACTAPAGYVSEPGDCSDNNPNINPGQCEDDNGFDDDCDGQIDEDTYRVYPDRDYDGYGDAGSEGFIISDCSIDWDNSSSNNLDCNDYNSDINPDGYEYCDGEDNDCDGLIDEGTTQTTHYRDADGDGYGIATDTVMACRDYGPDGYAEYDGDCNDGNAAINPDSYEICDGLDNNCNGQIDEDVSGSNKFYRDADGDGYGNINTLVLLCAKPAGYVTNSTDCNDGSSKVYPNATEICDGLDNDCDGQIDEGFVTKRWYLDFDKDGFGKKTAYLLACSPPTNYVADSTDCHDGNLLIYPGATEICDGKDNDCDGQIDEGVKTTYYRDADGDGYGTSATTTQACTAPTGYVTNKTDCNDANANVKPGATEICDGLDNDCDGQVDEGLTTKRWYLDFDKDGYGKKTAYLLACSPPANYVADSTDCHDGNNLIYPGALEIADGKDNDCNGLIDDITVRSMKVNIFGGVNPYSNAEWNNWNVSSSLSSGALKYTDASISSVSAALSASTVISDNGATYGGTMAPPEVLRYTSNTTAARTLTFSGLSTTKSYSLELYASRNVTGQSTVFTIGTTAITIVTDKNLTNKASFVNLVPNTSGQLVVSIKSGNTNNYINGFILTEKVVNKAPVVNAGADKTITLPTSSVTLSGTATDADGTIAAYKWTQVSGPALATFSSAATASTTASALKQGTYVFRLTATDNKGATGRDDIKVVVNAAPITKYIKVNLFGGVNPYNNVEWNNWNVSASLNSGVLKYPDATVSTVSAAITRNTISDNGATYGGTMAPAEVLRYASYSSVERTLTLSGLSTSKSYSLELYASRATSGNSTVFTLNGTAVTIVTDNNKTNKAVFTGLKATAGGQLIVSIKNLNSTNYLNGFILSEITSTTTATTSIAQAKVAVPELTSVGASLQVQAYPNPSQHYFTLQISSNSDKPVQLRVMDATGRVVELKQGIAANTTVPVGHSYGPGVYFAEVLQDGKRAVVKLVKGATF